MTAAQHAFTRASAIWILRAALKVLDLLKLSPFLSPAEFAGITLIREGVDLLEDKIEPDTEESVAVPPVKPGPPIPPPMPPELKFPPVPPTRTLGP